MKTTLLIARHGNTFGPNDIVTRVGGKTDLPLVESGLIQGQQLGLYLKQENLVPDHIYTSHLQRTKQTAEQAQIAMGTNLKAQEISTFNEIDYGPDENKPETEVVARLGQEALDAWDRECIVPQGWKVDPEQLKKDWVDFGHRVEQQHAGRTILVVSSNGIIRFAPCMLSDKADFDQAYQPKVSTGSLGLFVYQDGIWFCEGWNIKPKDFVTLK